MSEGGQGWWMDCMRLIEMGDGTGEYWSDLDAGRTLLHWYGPAFLTAHGQKVTKRTQSVCQWSASQVSGSEGKVDSLLYLISIIMLPIIMVSVLTQTRAIFSSHSDAGVAQGEGVA